ncbi:hypothetical protein EDD71_10825 [Fonticella tunisiensis]|uniref:Uncharacterized protein n=1 Tax=Fonticella tunisiensis TaxID=1096341 RepID=A0A4R7KTB5_9CLOT|nr:hypothetical protein EDD71_10825 [Fonticella tunisiensis]
MTFVIFFLIGLIIIFGVLARCGKFYYMIKLCLILLIIFVIITLTVYSIPIIAIMCISFFLFRRRWF